MQLRSQHNTFGRHESFPLRFGWLTKGVRALKEDPQIFEKEYASVRLGVGKNMASAIKYWLVAAGIYVRQADRKFVLTEVGRLIFDQQGDPYIEDGGTIWLLHWLMASNAQEATAIYWFFNHFHKPEFSAQEIETGLRDFVTQNMEQKVAARTIKNDAALLHRMYSSLHQAKDVGVEDVLDSPLSSLKLIERSDSKHFRASTSERHDLPLAVFAFAVLQQLSFMRSPQLSIELLMYSSLNHCAPGSIFRLTEDGLLLKLEQLCAAHPTVFKLDQTAGVHQFYKISDLDLLQVLYDHYSIPSQGESK